MDDHQFEKQIDTKYRSLKEKDGSFNEHYTNFSKLSRVKQNELLRIIETELNDLLANMTKDIQSVIGHREKYEKSVLLNYEADKLSLRKTVLRKLIEENVHSKGKKSIADAIGKIMAFIIMLPSRIFFFLQLDILGVLIAGITSLAVWCCIVIWPISVFISLMSFNKLSHEDIVILLGGSVLYFILLLALKHLPMFKDK